MIHVRNGIVWAFVLCLQPEFGVSLPGYGSFYKVCNPFAFSNNKSYKIVEAYTLYQTAYCSPLCLSPSTPGGSHIGKKFFAFPSGCPQMVDWFMMSRPCVSPYVVESAMRSTVLFQVFICKLMRRYAKYCIN